MDQQTPKTDNLDDDIFYAAALNAWFTTRLEQEKVLFLSSLAALGFLIHEGKSQDLTVRFSCFFYGAIGLYIACIICVGMVFRLNGAFIEKYLQDKSKNKSPLLDFFDGAAFVTFISAIISSVIHGMKIYKFF